MNTTLTELYHLFAPQVQTEGERAILERNKKTIECIERQLSEKDISAFMDVQTELGVHREEQAFALGFQLAARVLAAVWQ